MQKYFSRLKPLFFVCLSVALCSCGAQHKLSKAERLIKEAIEKGAKIKDDTIYKHIELKVPGVAFNTTLQAPNWDDTVRIIGKDSLIVKIKRIVEPGKTETVYVEAKCPDKIVIKKIPVTIEREIRAGYSLWQLVILAAVCLVVGYFGGVVIRLFT